MKYGHIFIVASLFVGGCVRIPESEQAVSATSVSCNDALQEAVATGVVDLGDSISKCWWEDFGDDCLTNLIATGIQNSPTLKVAEERLKAAAQTALQKKSALYPELDLDAFDLWTHLSKEGFFRAFAPTIPPVVNDFFIGLSFSYEFDFWGKNRSLFNAAMGDWAAAHAETMQAELVLTTAIAYTYYELQFLLCEANILDERKQNRTFVTDFHQTRVLGALDTAMDPLKAQSDTLDIEATLTDLKIQIQLQIQKIKALAGMGQDEPLEIALAKFNPVQLSLPDSLGLDLIGRRPDLFAQRQRLEAAAKRVDAAKTDFYPNINLKAFLGTDSVIWSKLFRWENYDLGVAPALHLPIFTAGRIRAALYEKLAEFNEAVYTYNGLILEAARQVAESLAKVGGLMQEIQVRQKSLEVALSLQAIVNRRFDSALAAKIDILQAQDEVLKKNLMLAQLQYGAQLAKIELIRNLGGGFHE